MLKQRAGLYCLFDCDPAVVVDREVIVHLVNNVRSLIEREVGRRTPEPEWAIEKLYADLGRAPNLRDLPDMLELQRDCLAGLIDVILIVVINGGGVACGEVLVLQRETGACGSIRLNAGCEEILTATS